MIRNKMTLKHLEALVFVVDTGTFRAAANALNATQPNISARISALEEALGDTLLLRDAGSVRLTAKGTTIVTEARKVLHACEALLEAADRRDLIQDRLRLGVTELIAFTWLHAFLRDLRAEYPGLRVELEVDLAAHIAQRMRLDELDLAILSGPIEPGLGDAIKITSNRYAWVASPDMAQTLGRDATLLELSERSIITHARNTQAVRALEKKSRELGVPKGRIVHSSSLAACVPMAIDGMGVALLPNQLIRDDVA